MLFKRLLVPAHARVLPFNAEDAEDAQRTRETLRQAQGEGKPHAELGRSMRPLRILCVPCVKVFLFQYAMFGGGTNSKAFVVLRVRAVGAAGAAARIESLVAALEGGEAVAGRGHDEQRIDRKDAGRIRVADRAALAGAPRRW